MQIKVQKGRKQRLVAHARLPAAEYLLLAEVAPVAELRETRLPRLSKRTEAETRRGACVVCPRTARRPAPHSFLRIRRSKSDKPGKFIDDGNPIPKLRWLQRGLMADRADGLSTKLASNWPTALLQSLNCFILRHEAQCFAYLKLFSAIFNLLITHKILRISVIFFSLGVPAFMELRFSANFKPVKKLLVGPFKDSSEGEG